ncbi:MAG: alanine--tRNA ligase-related protein [Candidatus Nanosyncoccaceae bacterium]|jgi:alanyl-tRNA synthetase
MTTNEIRQAYLDFFIKRQHELIARAPLVLKDDPTTLFTGSGMQPLMPYLLGKKHPQGQRLTDSQPSLRSQDIDDVGDNRHTTVFEMLGNWSLGDYGKKEQIRWFFEFLTQVVGLEPDKIYATCFIGDEKHGIPADTESVEIWQELFAEVGIDAKVVELGSAENGDNLGLQGGRIFLYDDKENWWSRGGGIEKTPIGDPCGPDSEVFYDFGEENQDPSFGKSHPASDGGRFMEIGNQVFMEYRRLEDGSFEPLKQKNIDFGAGLERIAAARLDAPDVFQGSLFQPIIKKLEEISGQSYADNTQAMRIITDHLRSAVWLAVDGCVPSNKEHGYVMRRFVRRAMVKSFALGIENSFFEQVVPVIIETYEADYPEFAAKKAEVLQILVNEEVTFRRTLRNGLRQLDRLKASGLTGAELFKLYDTYGFPLELSLEEARRQQIKLVGDWQTDYDKALQEQRERSQTASKGMFKGGLEGQTDKQLRLHTAAHLMLAAMKQVLGEDVSQKGSNINDERLRFDFNYPEKVSRDKLDEIEKLVNQAIVDKLPVSFEEMSLDEAKKQGAHGDFMDRYGDKVKVYAVGEGDKRFSYEICGGPHVTNTGDIAPNGEKFKITKEESSSAGVRRVKAVLQ